MQIKASLKGALISFIILFIFSIALSIYYHLAAISIHSLNYLISFSIASAFLLGGFSSGYSSGEKGLYTGAASALIAILTVLILVFLGADASKDWLSFAVNSAFALIASGIGGIIGVSKN